MQLKRDFCALGSVSITMANVLAQESLVRINTATSLGISLTPSSYNNANLRILVQVTFIIYIIRLLYMLRKDGGKQSVSAMHFEKQITIIIALLAIGLIQRNDVSNVIDKQRLYLLLVDAVDVETSFPLSRFVNAMESLNVNFAVGGANTKSLVGPYDRSGTSNRV